MRKARYFHDKALFWWEKCLRKNSANLFIEKHCTNSPEKSVAVPQPHRIQISRATSSGHGESGTRFKKRCDVLCHSAHCSVGRSAVLKITWR